MRLTNKFPFITRSSLENPSTTLKEYFATWDGAFSNAGFSVNAETALTLSAVWRAINIISSTIASLPVNLFKTLPDGDTQKIVNHPGIELMKFSPNSIQTPFLFIETMQTGPLTWGNAYAWIHKNGNGNPLWLEILHPSSITAKRNNNSVFYEYTPDGDSKEGRKETIPSRDMLHIPGLGYNGIIGKSPITVAGESLSGGMAVQKFGNQFFENGAMQSGVVEHPSQLGKQSYERLISQFNKRYSGLSKAGGTMLLEEGMKYNPLSFPLEALQFLSMKKFTVTEVARWYGLPPHFLADLDRSTYSNIESQGIEFVVYSLRAWLKRWEQELDRKLLKESERKDHHFSFNIEGLLRGDSKGRGEFYRVLLDLGVVSINEVRRLENLNKIAGGDKHLVQLARTDLNKIDNNEK